MDLIKKTLFTAFTSASHKKSSRGQSQHENDNPIKGIYARLQHRDGILIIAFHDLRDAASALACVQNNDIDEIASGRLGSASRERLHCRFIMPQDLEKVCDLFDYLFFPRLNSNYISR